MRVLVTAASRHGSTGEIAAAIGRVLTDARIEVDVSAPEDVATLEPYDAVILGSAVYMSRWLEPATSFLDRFAEELLERRVWLFSSGPLGVPPKPAGGPVDVAAIEASTRAIEHRVFPGSMDRRDLGFGEKLVVAGVRAPYGDFRPWDEIADWAGNIARTLEPVPVAS
jgi:menaquinone-dependent protoporphyrinogen oxidase